MEQLSRPVTTTDDLDDLNHYMHELYVDLIYDFDTMREYGIDDWWSDFKTHMNEFFTTERAE